MSAPAEDYRGASAFETNEMPAWAVELTAEVGRLRAENQELREALRGLAALLESQIDVLGKGRDELERRLAGGEREETAP